MRLLLAILVWTLLSSADIARCAELPEESAEALRSYSRDLNGISARWRVDVESQLTPRQLRRVLKQDILGRRDQLEVLYQWKNGKFNAFVQYGIRKGKGTSETTDYTEFSFDGEAVYSGTGKRRYLAHDEVPFPALEVFLIE